jgi:soluble lytic murein transglycosylase-like protein
MLQESVFNPNAKSSSGAYGLMQLMPSTQTGYNHKDPSQNVMAGAAQLKYLLNKYNNNLSLTLAAYNAGENSVTKAGGVPSSSQDYVDSVLKIYNSIK